ncbi:MAG TPA: hypothetical protein VF167_10940, partial [Longimicrobiaceae bacterium]
HRLRGIVLFSVCPDGISATCDRKRGAIGGIVRRGSDHTIRVGAGACHCRLPRPDSRATTLSAGFVRPGR